MQFRPYLTLLAIALLPAVSGATAAERATAPSKSPTNSAMSASDTLSLTSKQQATVWQDIAKQARKEKAPSDFSAKVGTLAPSTLLTYPVPITTSSKIPALRRYQYALLENNKLLIINPDDKKVADVITH